MMLGPPTWGFVGWVLLQGAIAGLCAHLSSQLQPLVYKKAFNKEASNYLRKQVGLLAHNAQCGPRTDHHCVHSDRSANTATDAIPSVLNRSSLVAHTQGKHNSIIDPT